MGAGVGAALAAGLHLWHMFAWHVQELALEGVAFIVYALAMLLGFPTNLLITIINIPVAGDYYALLGGIVLNWAAIFWLRGLRRARHLSRVDPGG